VVDTDGNVTQLEGPQHPPLGAGDASPKFKLSTRRLRSGERLILVTDGIIQRKMQGGGTFGLDGIKYALSQADSPTAASTVMAIQQAVTDCWREPLEDDATVVAMAIE
jgi:hypothetical protein